MAKHTYAVSTTQGDFDVDVEGEGEPTPEQLQAAAVDYFQHAHDSVPDEHKPWYKQALEHLGVAGMSQGGNSIPMPKTPVEAADIRAGMREGAASGARVGIPAAVPVGGPAGFGAGYVGSALGDLIEGKPVDQGSAVASGGFNAVPMGGTVGNMAKMGAMGAAAPQIRSLINEGKLAPAGDSMSEGAIAALLPAIAPILSRILGKTMGNVAPEEAARVAGLKSQNALEDKTLAGMTDRGAVIRPSDVNPTAKNAILEMLAGKTNLDNRASQTNRPIVNEVTRAEASIPANTAMDQPAFEAARKKIGLVYKEATDAGLGKQLEEWQQAHETVKEFEGGPLSVQERKDLKLAKAGEEAKFGELTQAATDMGRADLAAKIEEARMLFAKNYDAQAAANVGSGDIDASVFRQMLKARGDAGLTGGLNDVAKFQAAFPDAVKPTARLATAPSVATAGASLVAAAPGIAAGNPAAALVGGIPLLRGPAARKLLSPNYQANNARRTYKPGTSADPAVTAAIIRAAEQMFRKKEHKR